MTNNGVILSKINNWLNTSLIKHLKSNRTLLNKLPAREAGVTLRCIKGVQWDNVSIKQTYPVFGRR